MLKIIFIKNRKYMMFFLYNLVKFNLIVLFVLILIVCGSGGSNSSINYYVIF